MSWAGHPVITDANVLSCRSRNSRVNRTPRRSKRDSNRWSLSRLRHLIIAEEKGLQVDQGYLKGAIAFHGETSGSNPPRSSRESVSRTDPAVARRTLRFFARMNDAEKMAGYIIPKHDLNSSHAPESGNGTNQARHRGQSGGGRDASLPHRPLRL